MTRFLEMCFKYFGAKYQDIPIKVYKVECEAFI